MQDNKKVTFRKIRGRIVPIKLTNQQRADVAKGSAMIAGGTAVGIASGKAYTSVNRYATAKSAKAWRTLESIQRRFGPSSGSLFSYARKQSAYKLAFKANRAGNRIGKMAAPIRLSGRTAAALLIGAGSAKFYTGVSDRKPSTEKIAAVGSAASLAAFLTGAHGMAGFRRSSKNLYIKAYPFIRAVKSKLKL